jgi:hypothetical protein
MQRYLINLILLLLLILLVAVVWFKPFADDAIKTVSDLKPSDIIRIEIIRPLNPAKNDDAQQSANQAAHNENKVVLVRENNQWLMKAPIETGVNQARIRHLMTLLSEDVAFNTSANQQSLADFELASGKIILRFASKTQQESFVFGMNHPMNFKRYLLKSVEVVGGSNQQENTEKQILLASETVFNSIEAGAASFFSTQLLPKGVKLTKVELPKPYLSEKANINKWQDLNALYVASWDIKAEPSKGSVQLILENNEKVVFEILQTGSELWLGNHKLQAKYQIAESEIAELLPVASEK